MLVLKFNLYSVSDCSLCERYLNFVSDCSLRELYLYFVSDWSLRERYLNFVSDWSLCHLQLKINEEKYAFINRNQNSREKIEEMLETFELLDPWRTCFPNGRKYTWRQSSPIKQSRLDYFLYLRIFFHL